VPDENKHKALGAQGFKIARTCKTCEWWRPNRAAEAGRANDSRMTNWGRCDLAKYWHAKHSDAMLVGTPALGSCDRHAFSLPVLTGLVGGDYAARYAEDA
jgi:hypothetical protein